jgi:hypothetical protein
MNIPLCLENVILAEFWGAFCPLPALSGLDHGGRDHRCLCTRAKPFSAATTSAPPQFVPLCHIVAKTLCSAHCLTPLRARAILYTLKQIGRIGEQGFRGVQAKAVRLCGEGHGYGQDASADMTSDVKSREQLCLRLHSLPDTFTSLFEINT